MDNNILIAEQNDCNLSLAGNSEIFRYKDADGNIQSVDIKTLTDGTSLFENNQNINVDWEVDMPNLTNAANMFKGSNIKSFAAEMLRNSNAVQMFADCADLNTCMAKLYCTSGSASPVIECPGMFENSGSLTDADVYGESLVSALTTPFSTLTNTAFKNCINLRNAKCGFKVFNFLQLFVSATEMFMNCTSLDNISLSYTGLKPKLIQATDMFKGCKLGPKQLQQVLDAGYIAISTSLKITTTIGYDPELVNPSVDKPEGSELTWAEAFAAQNWTVTWEAYTPPVENAPKLLMAKAPKQKLYKLDEVPEEALEFMGDMDMYTKDGKRYLMTSGDSVTAPGPDGTLLRDTEVENVVRAGSLKEAIEKLGVVPVSE